MPWPKGKLRDPSTQHQFTPEERERASARMKLFHEQKRLKKQQALAGTATTSASVDTPKLKTRTISEGTAIPSTDAPYMADTPLPDYVPDAPRKPREIPVTAPARYDWINSPIEEAIIRLSDMKREYDRAAQIILQRTSEKRIPLVCWAFEHKASVSRQVLAQCKRQIPDAGKAAFIDNGYKENPSDPQEKPHSIYCCSMLCYMSYQKYRSELRAPRIL